MPTLFKYFKKWLLGLFFKAQYTRQDTQSKEVKAQGTDTITFTGLTKEFEDNKPAVQREQWFQTANNLMDADFAVDGYWNNHDFVPRYNDMPTIGIRVEVLGHKFTDEVGDTKYQPHRDRKITTAHYISKPTEEIHYSNNYYDSRRDEVEISHETKERDSFNDSRSHSSQDNDTHISHSDSHSHPDSTHHDTGSDHSYGDNDD